MTLKYDTLLFDIDDTLLDFKKSESSALKKAFKNRSYHFDSSIEESGLRPYFKDIFISEDIGCQKPKKEFFDYVSRNIPGF